MHKKVSQRLLDFPYRCNLSDHSPRKEELNRSINFQFSGPIHGQFALMVIGPAVHIDKCPVR